MSERYINNLTGDFSICFSEHLTEHPTFLIQRQKDKCEGTQGRSEKMKSLEKKERKNSC